MRILSILFVLTLLVSLVAFPAAAQEPEVAITLERTACFGTCPVYTVTIYADGTVVYNGGRFVDVTGEQTTSIDPETVQQLIDGFEAAGYFDWGDTYTDMYVTDLPTITTSVTRDGETKTITRYAGDNTAPTALPYLENWIDRMTNSAQWTGEDILPTYSISAPVITLERTQCFGACPMYTVNLFSDGTVVYLGIQYVDVVGVQISHVEPSVVEGLVREMTMTGYFAWNDAYTHTTITDQPSVITSLMTDEGYKQIVRYGGDANAPLGLTWIEDHIDTAVNSAQWISAE